MTPETNKFAETLKLKPSVKVLPPDKYNGLGWDVCVADTDFCLGSFDTKKDAVRFCRNNGLKVLK